MSVDRKVFVACIRLSLTMLLVIGLSASSLFAADTLENVPDNAVFCVKINNLQKTAENLDQYMLGASPVPMSFSALVTMQMGALLGNPALEGLDISGDFVVFGLPIEQTKEQTNAMDEMFIGLILPISDYDNFIAKSPTVSEPDENGISTITIPSMPVPILIKKMNDFALVNLYGPMDYFNNFKKSKTSITDNFNKQEKEAFENNSLACYGNLSRVYKQFEPMFLAQMDM